MNVVEEVNKIDRNTATGVSLFFFSILSPGLLIMFLYQRALFVELETLKLVLISLALSIPGFILPQFISSVCVTVYSLKLNVSSKILGNPKEWFYRNSINNAINMYALIFIGYVSKLQFYEFAWYYLVSIFILCVFEMFYLIIKVINPDRFPSAGDY